MAVLSRLRNVVTTRNCALAASSAIFFYVLNQRKFKRKRDRLFKDIPDVKLVIKDAQEKKEKAAVDGIFFRRILRILKIVIPGWWSPEFGYLMMVAAALIARTYCDVWMIQNGTSIESSIIGRDMTLFKRNLLEFVYAMPILSIVNNVMKYGLSQMKIRFRTRLTLYLYSKYLNGFTYYKMSNLDNRIANADQLLTEDVEKFCTSLTELYSNLSKPFLDIFVYAVKLTGSIGAAAPAYMLLYLVFSGLVLNRIRRPLGKMTMIKQRHEGEFRYVNSRLITNSEEVAFYQGNKREKDTVMSTFVKLIEHLQKLVSFQFVMGFGDNIIAKYIATIVGFTVVSRPFLNLQNPKMMHSTKTERLENYYKSGRMLVRMAESIGRVVLAGREMTQLAGFTARVYELMRVLDDLNKGRYERTMVTDKNSEENSVNKVSKELKPGSGKLVKADHIIKFDHVPLVTPNGDVLIEDMSFEVKSGINVLVCGPNGCGKSSLFRTLGELWPLFGGTLTKPDGSKLFYIPQRPYMTLGTLRDQVIYPDTHQEQIRKKLSDTELCDLLERVKLGYILDREGGWDSVQDWMDVLSGGEKQRIAMARLFYHKPQFAILDECTSAVSVDVEGNMYAYCREVGITLFTVSHRKSLWKHHEFYLHMDGRGAYEFKPITSETLEFGS